MKRLFLPLFLVFLLFSSSNSQNVDELRGVWITNVDSYVMYSDKNIADAMDYLASIGINVIFPVVWNKGYTLYPSDVMNYHFQTPIIPVTQFQNRDPLDRLVIEAHRVGIEVIPWFEFGFSTSYSLSGGHIIAKYPHWALRDWNGNLVVKNGFDWMAGTNPEVQDFMISLVTEVVDKYDVDGIQGDDRLPAMPTEGGYDSVTVAIYKSENSGAMPPQHTHNEAWKRWRANKLNSFFQRLKDSVKIRSPHLLISAAPSVYPWGYDNYLQDSKTWVDSGIAENFIPQIYRYDLASYSSLLQSSLNYVPLNKRDIFFSGVLIKAGSYLIPIDYLIGAITANRNRGVKGETFFFYEGLVQESGIRGDTLFKRFYSQPASLPYRNGKIFRPKADIKNEDEEGVNRIGTWQLLPAIGYRPNIYVAGSGSYASITYNFDVKYDAWYSVYAFQVPNFIFSNSARYVLYSDTDSTEVIFDQRNTQNTSWRKIGDTYLTNGNKSVLKLDNTTVEPGKSILADAVMIKINRKLSPDVIITSVDEENNDIIVPDELSLEQNYPNPFNPVTTIRFSLPNNDYVALKIFDLLGRELITVTDGFMEKGNYSYSVDMGRFSTGIYFYSLITGNSNNSFTQTKKMILVK